MSPTVVGAVATGVLFIFLFAGMPIAFGLFLMGFLGFCYLTTVNVGLGLIGIEPLLHAYSYDAAVMPLFILMGAFASSSGLSRDFYTAAFKWIGHVRGGLAMATIGACAAFAAVCGSSLATAATMGSVALPEMRRFNYKPHLATGCVAAGGTLGILIPPSVIFILYGLITQQSIGKLFIAGIIPGIILALLFIINIRILTQLDPTIGPAGSKINFIDKLKASGGFVKLTIVFAVVMGGFFIGLFTPTEGGAIGAFLVLVIGLGGRRFTRKGITGSLLETGRVAGMIYMIIIGATIFNRFLAVTRFPFDLAEWISGLHVSKTFILILITIVYTILGCIMDSLAMVLITVPIFYPIILAIGVDPIWFGVYVVIMMEIGQVTPPVGLNVYIVQGVAKDYASLLDVWRGIIFLLPAMYTIIVLLILFPKIALFLPNFMR